MDNLYIWGFLIYAVGTAYGLYVGKRQASKRMSAIIEATIDRLIKDEYVKTKIVNGEVEMLKHYE